MTASPATVSELHDRAEEIADAALQAMPAPCGCGNLAEALVAALADLMVVEADQTATIPGKEGKQGYSYDYADLGAIVRRTRPALAAHGIVALTPLHSHGDKLATSVVLLHRSGERIDFGPFPFPHGRDAQATGSMVTYMRRYALVAALGMAAGKDDDGAGAQPAFVWTAGAVKQELVNRIGKEHAAEAWKASGGDQLTEFGPEVVERLVKEWEDNQPADEVTP